MLTIEEIKKRRIEGKRKWGSSLILLIKEKLDEDLPVEVIVNYLKETFDFSLTIGDLYQLKSKYYVNISKLKSEIIQSEEHLIQIPKKPIEIALNRELSISEKMYNDIYKNPSQTSVFDLGKDF